MSRAMGFYRQNHIDRAMGMMFKTIGFTPHGRVSRVVSRLAYVAMRRRGRRFETGDARAHQQSGDPTGRFPRDGPVLTDEQT